MSPLTTSTSSPSLCSSTHIRTELVNSARHCMICQASCCQCTPRATSYLVRIHVVFSLQTRHLYTIERKLHIRLTSERSIVGLGESIYIKKKPVHIVSVWFERFPCLSFAGVPTTELARCLHQSIFTRHLEPRPIIEHPSIQVINQSSPSSPSPAFDMVCQRDQSFRS